MARSGGEQPARKAGTRRATRRGGRTPGAGGQHGGETKKTRTRVGDLEGSGCVVLNGGWPEMAYTISSLPAGIGGPHSNAHGPHINATHLSQSACQPAIRLIRGSHAWHNWLDTKTFRESFVRPANNLLDRSTSNSSQRETGRHSRSAGISQRDCPVRALITSRSPHRCRESTLSRLPKRITLSPRRRVLLGVGRR